MHDQKLDRPRTPAVSSPPDTSCVLTPPINTLIKLDFFFLLSTIYGAGRMWAYPRPRKRAVSELSAARGVGKPIMPTQKPDLWISYSECAQGGAHLSTALVPVTRTASDRRRLVPPKGRHICQRRRKEAAQEAQKARDVTVRSGTAGGRVNPVRSLSADRRLPAARPGHAEPARHRGAEP